MKQKILFVDDDNNILSAFKRQLRKFAGIELETSNSAEKALALMEKSEFGYSLVISDMRMPIMDGLEFLKEVQKISPNTVRMMLTGNTDQQTAIEAINQGSIFRFLTKPCSTDDLEAAIKDGVSQYKLITAEKELLQKTLSGSVKVLTDILSIVDPVSFGIGMNIRDSIRKLAKKLEINALDVELAGMLANIGFVTVPSVVHLKLQRNKELSSEENEIYQRVPEVGSNLLKNIPRLEKVSKIILYRNKNFSGSGFPNDEIKGEQIPIGSRIIRFLLDYEKFYQQTDDEEQTLSLMKNMDGVYDPNLFEMYELMDEVIEEKIEKPESYTVELEQLLPGQKLLAEVKTADDVLLIPKGVVLTEALIERLSNYSILVGLGGDIVVDRLDMEEED